MFGAPGSGKGTQGKILGAVPGFFHCACGDAFRSLRTDSEIGRIFVEYSSRGRLVPDETTVAFWRESISMSIAAGRFNPQHDILVLDGIPRNVQQARMLSGTLNVIALFYLCASDPEKMVERLQRRALKENRLDDANLGVIRERLKTYEQETQPVLDFYGKRIVHRINADETPLKISTKISRHVVKLEEKPAKKEK